MKKARTQLKKSVINGIFGAAVFFVIILTLVVKGVGNTDDSVRENGRRVAEEAVRRAAVSCYALEGAYPESYQYLKENYSVNINEDLYIVSYSIFASNIIPDITVIIR